MSRYRIAFRHVATEREYHDGAPIFTTRANAQEACDYLNAQYAGVTHHWPEEASEAGVAAATAPASPPHPAPSAMAREAYPDEPDPRNLPEHRAVYAAGIAAERSRIAAWLRGEAKADPDTAPQLLALADALEGK